MTPANHPHWVKKGLVYVPDGSRDWMQTHAAVPFAMPLDSERVRVYYCARDAQNRAAVGALDLTLKTLAVTHPFGMEPVFGYGQLGAYDDNGVISSWYVDRDERRYCYFCGVTLGVTVPFYFHIGLAISRDGGKSFERYSAGPILERDDIDPYLTGQCCVLFDRGMWRMWYVSGVRWERTEKAPKHYYHIKYAESADGIHWKRTGVVCIDFADHDEYAIGRPCVVKDSDIYRMWYCFRGPAYRMGYAESTDGIRWERKDLDPRATLRVSPAGWDSEMIAYAHVFDHQGSRYALYNGNSYGRTGVGLAQLCTTAR